MRVNKPTEAKRRALALYIEGAPLADIVAETGVSEDALHRYRANQGVPLRGKRKDVTTISVSITPNVAEILSEQKNASAYVCEAVEAYSNNQQK